jgi:hypothetical protein
MIRIGDFSKLSQVSIKALSYYDEMGLLKPISIDREFLLTKLIILVYNLTILVIKRID